MSMLESLQKWEHFDKLRMSWCVSGIVGCLLLYGVLQERVMVEPFGENEERFKFSLFLVLCNRLTTMTVAALGCLIYKEGIAPVAPLWNYCAVSVSNVVATFCQYEALKYVSFPVQTLGKCAKMIPVMIWGSVIMKKTYKTKDYLIAAGVTLGCTIFILTGSVKSKASKHMEMGMAGLFGVGLMLGYLGFDGFTSTFQDRMFKGYSMTIYNQILYVTMCSSALSAFGLISSGQFPQAIDFITRHPEALYSIMLLSCAATMGQLFISYTIRCYGALLFATVMTTRQFLSILLSCALFMHPLSLGQWGGTFIVFGSLYYKTMSHKPKDTKPEPPHTKLTPQDEESVPLKP
mmetsp:Transcript_23879/g.66228  ORF Transcript_23879/g.66228 Transcript_23879/m.66228 type:complete len:348 (-) Transcript_23879:260-1303(-)|eukprot:CAMPEP_0117667828 /NCGR_PEP_ID=MMETSP0804-20121206/11193_1 /TAXON_ID=1074897 /ORGANISM="Tetraselmis astigmatica, Strain CCMP880" /LENGTH=347 /DNA_ID=CAMNT_0005475617 /DNA_START=599 /DNA_END=1642 /DNA_ORIENTATION=-